MELKAVFRTATGVNIAIMVSGEERAALGLAIGDVCSGSRRLIYAEHILPRINPALALHTTSMQRYGDGCTVVLHLNEDLWSDIAHVCKQRGVENMDECAKIVVNTLSNFIEALLKSVEGGISTSLSSSTNLPFNQTRNKKLL
ncbi:MAG: hypothetical protein LM583_06470 [Desulfurococcaceae archaeon]|jgi:hypothetical protein|nr:hypothetical protein [Desulfurococcaceae archaeon]